MAASHPASDRGAFLAPVSPRRSVVRRAEHDVFMRAEHDTPARLVAGLLGGGIALVLLAGIAAAVARQPADRSTSATQPAATQPPAAQSGAAQPEAPPSVTTAAQHGQKPATPRHHPHAVTRPRKAPSTLPFTGPAPVAPSLGLGVLLMVCGCWLLVRSEPLRPVYEAARGLSALSRSPGRARRPSNDGAIARLRSPGHQLARPSSAATDGTRSDRTTKVSSNSPAVTANPVS